MTAYFDSAEGERISLRRALLELDRHGVPESERGTFFEELGTCSHYDAQDVLLWLGY